MYEFFIGIDLGQMRDYSAVTILQQDFKYKSIHTKIQIYNIGHLERIDGLLIDPGCIRLINGFLGGYCYPENKSIMGEYIDNILKNKYSHVHDGLQYLTVRLFESKPRKELIPGAFSNMDAEDWDILNS